MGILWAGDGALSPTEVQTELGDDLAYNTVLTILTRLLEKGLLTREPSGRGHAYRPVHDAATTAARQMRATLAHQADRHQVLLKFASGLEPDDVQVLRAFLAEAEDAPTLADDATIDPTVPASGMDTAAPEAADADDAGVSVAAVTGSEPVRPSGMPSVPVARAGESLVG